MQISQNLKLKQSQSLVMTPQLQQAIKLLQLNNVELCELVEKELEENPFLEKDNETDLIEQRNNEYTENVDEAFQNGESQYEDPSKGDYENRWDQDNNLSSKSNNFDTIDPGSIAEQTISEKVTLKSVLIEQANIAFKTSKEKIVSELLIDYIQPSGWLTTDLVELQNTIGCDEQTLNNVLFKMQSFEPTGVFARNLTECLRIQLENKDLLTDGISLLIENFDLLAKGEIKNLCKICGMSENELTKSIKIIKTLNPKPGSLYSEVNDQIFHPDVIVTQKNNQWEVELNNGTLPKIIVNENYIKELEKLGGNDADKKFISESVNSAKWLMKAIEQRNLTTLKISSEIVEQQKLFFEKGVSFLKPMILKDVAKKIKMHESTVSRVTTGKLMLTPRGILK